MGANWSAGRGVKRPFINPDPDNDISTGDLSDSSSELYTPKRKRFQSTAQYIVKKLFEEGTDSDVTIKALGKSWHLHKIYLSQCKYFDSMFNGQWVESAKPEIVIEITDENINEEALRIAFRSLYTDHILIKPIQTVGVLAAAAFLHLEPLIEYCRCVMKSCITGMTVCDFLAASESYGLMDIRSLCRSWLLRYLMVPKHSFMLAEISEDLMKSLLDCRDLWIMQVEVDIYCMLKKWVFTQMNPSWRGTCEQLYKDTVDFYKQYASRNACCFLETAEGRYFISIFERVRWMYIINDFSCIQSLKDDHIVPFEWLNPVFNFCWSHHLRVEQAMDIGPRDVSEADFYKWSMRCGRVLMHEQEYHWRWLGYSYGLDLLFTLRNSRVLAISRNLGITQRFTGALSQQETRYVMLCVKLAHLRKKELCPIISTGIRNLVLSTDDTDVVLLTLDPAVKFPLQVTMQLLYLTPDTSLPPPTLAVPPPPHDIMLAPTPCTASTPPPSATPQTPSTPTAVAIGDRVCAECDCRQLAVRLQGSGGVSASVSSKSTEQCETHSQPASNQGSGGVSAGVSSKSAGQCETHSQPASNQAGGAVSAGVSSRSAGQHETHSQPASNQDGGAVSAGADSRSAGQTFSQLESTRGGGAISASVSSRSAGQRETYNQSVSTQGGGDVSADTSSRSAGQHERGSSPQARTACAQGDGDIPSHANCSAGRGGEDDTAITEDAKADPHSHKQSTEGNTERKRGTNDAQKDSSLNTDMQRDGSTASNMQRDGSTASNMQRDESTASNMQRDGSTAIDLQRDRLAVTDMQRDRSTAIDMQRDGSTAINMQRDGSTAIDMQTDGSTAINMQRDGSTVIDMQRDGSTASDIQRDGSSADIQTRSADAPIASFCVLSSATAAVTSVSPSGIQPKISSDMPHAEKGPSGVTPSKTGPSETKPSKARSSKTGPSKTDLPEAGPSKTGPSDKAPSKTGHEMSPGTVSTPYARNMGGGVKTADTRPSQSLPSCVDMPSCSNWSGLSDLHGTPPMTRANRAQQGAPAMSRSTSDLQRSSRTPRSVSCQARSVSNNTAGNRVRRSARVQSRQTSQQ